jgi:uncharacterized protein (TIGR03437 family)
MGFAIRGQPAVLLPSGQVLVVGPTMTEIYDPATGAFTPAGQTVFAHGAQPTATLLNSGQVFIVGGTNLPSAAELYDPTSGQFVATGTPVQPHGYQHSATLLNDGRVLLVGGLMHPGNAATDTNAGAETYNPQTGAFTAAGPMVTNRNGQTATLLADGRVLIAAGLPNGNASVVALDSAEVYSPSTGAFTSTLPMTEPRLGHVAALLPNGEVLVAGGAGVGGTAELFDPATLAFIVTGSMNNPSRTGSRSALLSSGQVLVAGGWNLNGTSTAVSTASAELYNPATGTFEPTGSMGTPRDTFEATLLLDGRFLAAGGADTETNVALAEIYTPVVEGLVTSQTGLTFRVAAGNTTIPPQTVAVLSNTATIPWTVSTHTYEGGNWLSVTPTSGSSVPGAAPVTLTITTNPTGLATQDYYGAVILTPTDSVHPPVSIAIVLHIVPAGTASPPVVTPSGLLFLGTPGAKAPPQSFSISNLTSSAFTFNTVASASPSWFTFAPASGTVAAAQSTSIEVTATLGSMTAGVYPASIRLLFGDGSSQTVQLLLVISATAGTASARPGAVAPKTTATCTASKLLPVFTTIGTGFNTPAAWPTPIVVQVVDDCGNAFNAGSVIVSFSDGDPPISLLSIGIGNWAGTWVPEHSATGFSARADAQQLPLSGSVAVTGQVSSNPNVPIVETGGIVSSGDYASSPALGLLVSIFGTGMADQPAKAKTLPLPTQLGTTGVALSSGALLPLLYVSNQQINVLIPYEVAVNTTQQLVVLRDNAVSVPVSTAVFNSSPAILATAGNGVGQGHIYVVNSGMLTLADQNAPATAGDVLTIYCVGLGPVTPSVTSGAAAPDSPLSYTAAPVTVTIGGQVAPPPSFAGVTPGFAGLYQIDVAVPAGVTPGNQVPVTISVAGKSGPGNIYMAIH